MSIISRKQTGFTIVELLIVIVVIGILAAITIVAYNGVQNRANDSRRTSEIGAVKKALEMYYIDNNEYPSIGNDNTGYNMAGLSTALVPTYMAKLPTDPVGGASTYQYVRGTAGSNSYAIRMSYQSKTACHTGVNNSSIGWWGLAACS